MCMICLPGHVKTSVLPIVVYLKTGQNSLGKDAKIVLKKLTFGKTLTH